MDLATKDRLEANTLPLSFGARNDEEGRECHASSAREERDVAREREVQTPKIDNLNARQQPDQTRPTRLIVIKFAPVPVFMEKGTLGFLVAFVFRICILFPLVAFHSDPCPRR